MPELSLFDPPTADETVLLGRRERKKAETRQALMSAAIDLFDRQGFDETTIEDIADAVDVSRRTFHRYFERKEDVVFAGTALRIDDFCDAVAAAPEGRSLIETVRLASDELVADLTAHADLECRRIRLVARSDSLRAHNLRHYDRMADAVAKRASTRGGDEVWAALCGTCVAGALTVAARRWAARDGSGDLRADVVANLRHLRGMLSRPPAGQHTGTVRP